MKSRLPEAFLPKSTPLSVWRQTGWRGLDLRAGLHEGHLSSAKGIDPRALPTLTAAEQPARTAHASLPGKPLSLHSVNGVLYATVEEGGETVLYRDYEGEWQGFSLGNAYPGVQRTVLPFPYYNHPDNPLDNYFDYPMVTVFPDGVYLRPDKKDTTFDGLYKRVDGELPYLFDACLHLSRLFGVGGALAYASDHNCVTQWRYDTADSISASHAWYTTSHAGGLTKGDFTAIVSFGGRVLAFKEKSCQAITGSKNPFRMTELLSVGTTDRRTVAQVGDSLFFADAREVYRFDGEEIERIGTPLGECDLLGAMAASADGMYYLYVPSARRIFTYSPDTHAWCELFPFTEQPITAMVSTGEACLFLDEGGAIYSTAARERAPFSAETCSLVPRLSAPARPVRLRLTLTVEEGATLSLSCRFSDGKTVPLCTVTGGGAQRKSVPIPTKADTATSLLLTGEGGVIINEMDLITAETATDGA